MGKIVEPGDQTNQPHWVFKTYTVPDFALAKFLSRYHSPEYRVSHVHIPRTHLYRVTVSYDEKNT